MATKYSSFERNGRYDLRSRKLMTSSDSCDEVVHELPERLAKLVVSSNDVDEELCVVSVCDDKLALAKLDTYAGCDCGGGWTVADGDVSQLTDELDDVRLELVAESASDPDSCHCSCSSSSSARCVAMFSWAVHTAMAYDA